MKTIKKLIAVSIALVSIVGTASAQISFGAKIGAKINDLNFKQERYGDATNTGITGGLMFEYMFPKTNVGIEASLMYFYVKTAFDDDANSSLPTPVKYTTHFIELPINFKWKIGLPVARKVVTPYLTTGPSMSFIGGERLIVVNQIRCKQTVFDWNFGLGVELFKKVQIGINYGLALSNAYESLGFKDSWKWIDIDCKKNSWTFSATYMF